MPVLGHEDLIPDCFFLSRQQRGLYNVGEARGVLRLLEIICELGLYGGGLERYFR